MPIFSFIKNSYRLLFTMPPTDAKDLKRITWKRAWLAFGFLIAWVSTIPILDPAPEFEDADIYQGSLLKVLNGPKGDSVRILTSNGEVRILAYLKQEDLDELNENIGSEVIAWTYERPGSFLFRETSLIEIEIEGRRLLNRWEEVRARIKSNKGFYFLLVIGILISIFSVVSIKSLTSVKGV